MLSKRIFSAFILAFFLLFENVPLSQAAEPSQEVLAKERDEMYHRIETLTHVPWYYLAAMDRYEMNITRNKKEKNNRKTGITISPEQWSGELNPVSDDIHPQTIAFFSGIGQDGNGDGKAERNNDEDILYSIAEFLAQFGTTEKDMQIALWNYYLREKSVRLINEYATVFRHYNHTYLAGGSFPIPIQYKYNYRDTWGEARGWGGNRIHEGTDIFADYGTPVRSTGFGIIEVKGWNIYGGWRIGIRDLNNIYQYYAHLSSYNKKWKIGDIVAPGDVLGYVGSSGYGNPGTSGKFPPHLHYGMYRDNGKTEWSFDPYPTLRKLEQAEYKQRKK